MIRTPAVLAQVPPWPPSRARARAATRAPATPTLGRSRRRGARHGRETKNKHVNKYQKKDVKEHPWERGLRQAEEEDEVAPAPPTYALQADCFCEGAALARKRCSSTKPVLTLMGPVDVRFRELGRRWKHGVRGSLRVDAPSAVDVEMALSAAGCGTRASLRDGRRGRSSGELPRAAAGRRCASWR